MARDRTGFMQVNVGGAQDPVAPNAALLEQAGAYRGEAAKIDGIRTGEAISFATGVGKAAYEGYVESEAAKRAAQVTEGLNTPSFIGPVANEFNNQVQQLEEARAAGRIVGEPTPELINEWNERALSIARAAQGRVFSQKEAQARLAADMRTLIATHPAQAARIREVYNSYTGIGDWNTRQIQGALTAKEVEDEAAKRRARLLESDAKNITESGIASRFGVRSTEEVYQHLSQGTDDGVRMYSAMVAANMIKGANKQLTEGDMNVAFNSAVAGSIAAGAEVTQVVVTRLKQQGIDVENLGTLTPDKEERIRSAYMEVAGAQRRFLEGALVTVKDRIRRDPTMDATTVNNTIKMLEDRLKMPLATELGEMLNQIKAGTTSRLQTAQTAQAALSVIESGLNSMFDKEMVSRMRDPRQRRELVAANPDNKAIQELAKMMETGQANFSSTMAYMSQISNYLLNPAASAAAAGTFADAAGTEEGRRDIAAQIKLIKSEGIKAIDAYTPATELGSRAAVVTAEHFVMDREWNSMFRSVMGDTYKNVLKNTPQLITEFEQKFAARAKYHLTKTLPDEIRSTLATAPGLSLSVTNGRLVLSGEAQPGVGGLQAQVNLNRAIVRANELLLSYNKVTNGEYDVNAFMSSLRPATPAAPAAIPANALPGAVSTVPTRPIGGTSVRSPIRGAEQPTTQQPSTPVRGNDILNQLKSLQD